MDPHRRQLSPIFDSRYHHHHHQRPSSPPLLRFSSSSSSSSSSAIHPHLLAPSPFPSSPPPPPPLPSLHNNHRPRLVDPHHRDDDGRLIPPYIPAPSAAYSHLHRTRDLLLYVPVHQKPPPPRVSSDRPIFPDAPRPRRIPRDLHDHHNDEDDRPFRVRSAALDRVPARRDEQLVMPQGRIEVVAARKRQSREVHEYIYPDEFVEKDDGSPVARMQRKTVFLAGGLRRRGDLHFEPDPPDPITSSILPPDRYREEDKFVQEKEVMAMIDRERERERGGYVSEEFEVGDYGERQKQFLSRGKRPAFGSISQDVSSRKRSVWQRLEELPYSPREMVDVPMDLDVSLRSTSFVAKEVSMSPSSRDASNIDTRNTVSLERSPRKEPVNASSDSPKSSAVAEATLDGVIAKESSSEKDALPLSPTNKPKKNLSISKPTGGSHGEKPSCAEKLASSKLPESDKSLQNSSEAIACKTSVPAPERATFPDQTLASSMQMVPSQLKGKVPVSPSVEDARDVKKVNKAGAPKKRVVIRKRLVPRGTAVTKSTGKTSTTGAPATEIPKTATPIIPDKKASGVKVFENEVKPEISIPCASSVPAANEKRSTQEGFVKEPHAGSKIAKTQSSAKELSAEIEIAKKRSSVNESSAEIKISKKQSSGKELSAEGKVAEKESSAKELSAEKESTVKELSAEKESTVKELSAGSKIWKKQSSAKESRTESNMAKKESSVKELSAESKMSNKQSSLKELSADSKMSKKQSSPKISSAETKIFKKQSSMKELSAETMISKKQIPVKELSAKSKTAQKGSLVKEVIADSKIAKRQISVKESSAESKMTKRQGSVKELSAESKIVKKGSFAKELNPESKTAKKMPSENIQGISSLYSAPRVAMVSPSKNGKKEVNAMVEGKIIPEGMLSLKDSTKQKPDADVAIAGKANIVNKQISQDPNMCSITATEPGIFSSEGVPSSSNDTMLALEGNLSTKFLENKSPPGNAVRLVTSACETVMESSISQDSCLCPDVKAIDALATGNKGNREELTSSCPNIVTFSVPHATAQSSNITASVIPTEGSVLSEGAHFAAASKSKKRKRRKKKNNNKLPLIMSDIKASPSASQTENICKVDASGGFQKDPVHPGERSEVSKSADQVEEVPNLSFGPCTGVNFSGAQGLPTLSNSCPDPIVCMPSNTLVADAGSVDPKDAMSCFALHDGMLHKSSQKITVEFPGQKKNDVSVGKEEGCGHLGNYGVKDLYPVNNIRGRMSPASQLPIYGQQPISDETVVPFLAGNKDAGKNEVVQLEEPSPSAVAQPMEVASDGAESNQISSLLPSNVVPRVAVVCKTDGSVLGKRNIEGGKNVMEGIGMVEKKPKICLRLGVEKNGSLESRTSKQDNVEMQEMLNVVPPRAEGSISNLIPTTADRKDGDRRLIAENRLLGSGSSSHEVGQSLIHKPFDWDRIEPKARIKKQKDHIQIEELLTVTDVGHSLGNSDNELMDKSSSNSRKLTLESRVDMDLDKTPVCVDHDKNIPSSLSKVKTQLIGGSQIVTVEETGSAKLGQDRSKPRAFPQPIGLTAKQPARIAPGLNGRNRTWHRTDSLHVSQSPAHLKFPITSSLQRQKPKRTGNTPGSYVRKGNSLIRRSSELNPSPQPFPVPGSSSKTTSEISNSKGLDTTISGFDGADNQTPGKFYSAEKPRSPPLPQSSKQSCSTGNLFSSQVQVSRGPSDVDPEDQAKFSKMPDLEPSIPNFLGASSIELLKGNDSKRMVYVKHKSNQLVATTGSDANNPSSFPSTKTQTPPPSSDLYYMRKNNKLIRDTSSSNLTKLGSISKSNGKNHMGELLLKKAARKGKSLKKSKFSSVWRLNSVHSHVKDALPSGQHGFLPYIFPWKRATYRRTSLMNPSKSTSLKSISKRLQIFRKRNTVYTISKGGFVLRKSGIRSIGGRSLKWSKSIEKRTKKANEEATLAVAEVQRVRREGKGASHGCGSSRGKKHISKERIFRVGNVRYKMDSSKRTLVRIPDDGLSSNSELQHNSLKFIIPRRLIIGHHEYVRVGNGNQLVRDPKRLVRILASEKVRWSLHTARQRLAKKQQYCQFFTRYGKCNKEGRKCPYIHDPTKVAICTKFLKGLCSGTNCRLTHKVIPERMPDCSYFLRGHCTNASCPYRHVKVNPRASVCDGFLRGYCKDGDECQKKHSYACPDFEATGKCFQGSDCKLHHPKSKNKSKKKKMADVKLHSKGRYFGSDMTVKDQAQILGAGKNSGEDSMEGIFSEGHMVDYISLDVGFEEESMEKNGQMYLLPHELDSDLSENLECTLDALIKPVRIMNTNEYDIRDVTATEEAELIEGV